MLGGKQVIIVALLEAIIFAGLLLGILMPRYALAIYIGSAAAAAVIFLALYTLALSQSRKYQCLGLTVQYVDGSDDYFVVKYSEMPVDLGVKDGRHCYAIKTKKDEWILQLDHPLEEVLPRLDRVEVAGMLVPVPVRYLTGVLVSENIMKKEVKPTIIQRLLRIKPPDAVPVREVYAYATPATAKRLKGSSPAFTGIKSLFPAYVEYAVQKLNKELELMRDHIEDLQKMLDDHLPITMKVKDLRIEYEGGIKTNWKVIALLAAAAAGVVLLLYYLGVFG